MVLPSEREQGRWSSIPRDILVLIAEKIVSTVDYVRFAAVCRSWHSPSLSDEHRFEPLYMYGTDPDSRRVTLRDPASSTALALELPEAAGRRCWGSPFGWIIAYDSDFRLNLVNPLTGATITLPAIGGVTRAFLTANPETDPENCLVVVVVRFNRPSLWFVRPGVRPMARLKDGLFTSLYNNLDPLTPIKTWSLVKGELDLIDLIHCKGNLYGLRLTYAGDGNDHVPKLVRFDLKHRENGTIAIKIFRVVLNPIPSEEINMPPNCTKSSCIEQRLVDLNGELCLCERYFNSLTITIHFQLYKIDLSTRDITRVFSLGDRCLFLGNNYSFSYKAAYPRSKLFEKHECGTREFVSDYVFYAQDREYGNEFDVEVWDMSRSTKVCSRKDSAMPLYGPLWIVPSTKH